MGQAFKCRSAKSLMPVLRIELKRQNMRRQAMALRKKFTGYEKDAETGLDFAAARYYNNQY